MSIYTFLSKYSNYYRKNGFFWLCRHIITHLICNDIWVILESEIDGKPEMVKARIPVNIRLLSRSEEDINNLTEFWITEYFIRPASTPEMIKNRIKEFLSAGDECMIAESDGKIVHMNWIRFHDNHIFEPFEKKRGLGPGEALSHNTFCADAYRGNHIMGAVRSKMFNFLAQNNYKTLVNYITPGNHAAMKVTKQFGGKPVQTLYSIKIFGISIFFLAKRS